MKDIALTANTIRGLAMDGVQAANSGHPGMPMGSADYAAVLFMKHMNYSASDPDWANRDRFVLSAGHGSMLIYSLLHLAGYAVSLDDLKNFRQLDTLTPGHPEYGHTPGVEATTGPLGQGISNAAGMALAEAMLAERYNTDDIKLVDHYSYAICGDGDLMEGISHEAFSLAGHLGLGKLILLHDYNHITIEGRTELAYSDDVRKRMEAYSWHVLEVDGHNLEEIDQALTMAKAETSKPTMIICTTDMGHGSPNLAGTSKAHGAPLGDEEIAATKKNLGMPENELFYVPEETKTAFGAVTAANEEKATAWKALFEEYKAKYPEKAVSWEQAHGLVLPDNLADCLPEFTDPIATRNASGKVLQKLAEAVPYLVGGSADLAPSNKTNLDDCEDVGPGSFAGRNLHFGIREHAMAAMMNGMALHGGLRVYGGTFMVFSDYCRPTIRLAAMMKLPVMYVFTHDSIYVGEDGPTHQPTDQITSLRAIPGLTTIRPAEASETCAAWVTAMENTSGPTALLLTRQNLDVLNPALYPVASGVAKGAYTVSQSGEGNPDVILIGSGSELEVCMNAAKELDGTNVRVVSMPSWDLFEKQDQAYRDEVLPPACKARVAVEAACPLGWDRYVGDAGKIIAMNGFGVCGPYKELAPRFGFTAENVAKVAKSLLD